MRVYLPYTLPALARLLREGAAGSAPARGYAVTPALREWYSSGDEEELEYVAMMQAARSSLRMLHADRLAPPRRVVLAAEVPDQQVTCSGGFDDPALVQLSMEVRLRDVASGHIDDLRAEADIRAAVAALAAADSGDEDARFTVNGAEGHELLWYATQELPQLTG